LKSRPGPSYLLTQILLKSGPKSFFGPQTWLKLSSKIDGGVAEMWRLERC
jgi:hypothetical protein